MADVVQGHTHGDTTGSGMGFFLGIILLVVLVIALLYWGLPYLRGGGGGSNVSVPGRIDVNVNQPK